MWTYRWDTTMAGAQGDMACHPGGHHYVYNPWTLSFFNSSPLGQNGRHFADDIFNCIFVNEKFRILIKNSLKFVPRRPIDNNPALVQIMACRLFGADSLTHICGIRGRWVKSNHWNNRKFDSRRLRTPFSSRLNARRQTVWAIQDINNTW